MSHKNTPSDAYFKSSMQQVDVARDLFRAHLPKALLDKLNLQKLELRSETFIDEDLKKHMVDVLYQTTYDEQAAYVYILTEHQSQAQKILPIRLFKYILLVMDYHLKRYKTDKPPLVIPLVIYNGKAKYPYSMDWLTLFEDQESLARELYTKPFQLADLTQIEDETLRNHASAGLMMWCLKHARHQKAVQNLETLLNLLDQAEVFNNEAYLLQSIRYMMYNMNSEDTDTFISTVKAHLPQPVAENMMTIAENLKQQGIQEGEVQVLLDLIECKFDVLPDSYRMRVTKADPQSLRTWIRNILKADTLDEVFMGTKH